jgi:hypothetical protein
MRPLIVDDVIRARIEEVIKYAGEHIYTKEMHEGIPSGKSRPPGDFMEYNVIFPFGYRAVFSLIETDKGLFRVLTVSVPVEGQFPSVHAFTEFIKLFKFRDDFDQMATEGRIRFDEDLSGKPVAVMALEKHVS